VGITDDPGLRQAARVRAHAIVVATESGVTVALISKAQYDEWIASQQRAPSAVTPVDISRMGHVVNLTDLVRQLGTDGAISEAEVESWRPIIGGKSAGFITLLATPGLTPPPDPLAITVRPYIEHIAGMRALIARVIADPEVLADPRARWLVLEGPDDYAGQFPTAADAEYAADLVARRGGVSAVGAFVEAGG
ncbi:MAG TPA: hypothetical protein PLV68_01680, partial [Ilumatobacteraceae bacterium]|nr:hypothetical protein [Ilumatobacteraceae bacterium]